MRKNLVPILLSIVGSIIVLFPSNPTNMTLPSRDSGVFLYMGWRLLSGDAPYRDVWDHKPPLIYLVDALGISLTPNSLWGIWLLQFVFIFFTIYFIYRLLDEEFGIYAALTGTIVLVSGLQLILGKGNVTEEYALVLQALAFWFFVRAWRKDFPLVTSLWIGVLGGLAFQFKQTTIGIWLTYAVFLLIIRLFQRKNPFPDLLSVLAGCAIPTAVVIVYLGLQDALMDYWEQAFLYNFAYIGKHEGIRRLIPVFTKGFAYLSQGWVLYLAVLGWLVNLGYAWLRRREVFREAHPLLLVSLVNFPIEVFLITISGRSILHYYLTILPVMAILAGSLIYTIPFFVHRLSKIPDPRLQRWAPAFILGIVLLAQYGQVKNYPDLIHHTADNDYAPVIEYVTNNTKAGEQVLLIGAESVVNFLTRREAPTRYVYQYPLALLGRRPMFEEYFNQILENKPVLIIDTRGRSRLDEKLYVPLQKRSEIVREGVKYLGENYQQVAQFNEWHVYRLAEKLAEQK